ncbi:MAG: MarR family transcriptional regulator [Actinobacteria bacterium]|nr:MarR family transcriptional regulator [Actinomycetota bacterium]
MRFDSPIDDIFTNRSHVRILRALHHLPEGLPASGREIARRAGVTHPTALRALAVLVDAGLVTAGRSSAGDAYELNRDHFFAGRIAELYQADAGIKEELATFLRQELLARADKVEWATLFGSIVWGESTPTSDIDLAVSCARADVSEVEKALNDLSDGTRRQFGNHVSPLINTRKQRPKSGIWKRIEEEGVPLIRSGKAISS